MDGSVLFTDAYMKSMFTVLIINYAVNLSILTRSRDWCDVTAKTHFGPIFVTFFSLNFFKKILCNNFVITFWPNLSDWPNFNFLNIKLLKNNYKIKPFVNKIIPSMLGKSYKSTNWTNWAKMCLCRCLTMVSILV